MTSRTATIWALLLLFALPARLAFADPEAEFKRGLMAYENGNFAEANQRADAGYLEKKLPKLLFLKAMSLFKLGKLAESWSLYQLILPKELPENLRDLFVTEYAATEQAVKQAQRQAEIDKDKVDQAKNAEQAKAVAAESARIERRSKANWLWVGTGVAVVAGGGLTYLGLSTASGADVMNLSDPTTHAGYHAAYSSARAEYYAGLALVGVGVGLGVWAAYATMTSAAEPQATVAPVWFDGGAGLSVAGRF